jgi:N-acetylneuraminic acid mutarotase
MQLSGSWKTGATVEPVRKGRRMRRLWRFAVPLLLGILLCPGTALAASPHGSGHFAAAASMTTARGYFTATELLNGNVLVAGGYSAPAGPPSFFTAAEIYHSRTGTWSPVAPMNAPRAAAVAVRLPSGNVLVAGGIPSAGTAEIYNPANNTWNNTGSLNVARFEDMAVALLPGGRVLVAGGFVPSATGAPPFVPLASTEIWHPRTGKWTLGKDMHKARGEFASVTLQDGRILVMGGVDTSGAALKSAEIYNPHTGHWRLIRDMHSPRFDAAAVVLHDGRVLVAGGADASGQPTTSSEIYNPRTKTWKTTGSLNVPRSEAEYAIVLMPDNRVLLAGGYNTLGLTETHVDSAEVYNPRSGRWAEVAAPMSSARSGHAAVLLRGNRGVLVMGGAMGLATATADIFHY